VYLVKDFLFPFLVGGGGGGIVLFLARRCFLKYLLLTVHVKSSQVLGTPTREEIKCMNPNYTEFKFPQIKAHPWHKVNLQST